MRALGANQQLGFGQSSQLPWWVVPFNPENQNNPAVNGGLLGGMQGGVQGGLKGMMQSPGWQAAAAAMLEASGPSQTPVGLGQALGRSMTAGRQATEQNAMSALQMKLMQKQLESQPQQPQRRTAVLGNRLVDVETGETITQNEAEVKPAQSREINRGDKVVTQEFADNAWKDVAEAPRWQPDRPVAAETSGEKTRKYESGDQTVTEAWDPVKKQWTRLASAPRWQPATSADKPPTEGEAKARQFSERMRQLSPDVVNEAPSITSQKAFEVAQDGGIFGGLANKVLQPKEQKHFNAARGWLSGILRGDTGATITEQEFKQYYPTYFPVPGDSKQVIEQKRQLRDQTLESMEKTGWRGQSPNANKPPPSNRPPLSSFSKNRGATGRY